ncbi:outer membrane lipoprotein carrier protein LolA [Bombella sp. TMW 2.2559]|uniref:Outer membrane lipoprotein carrier protein LolA n=1 Tax=Bombella dulcis TaxID=2967339 RepID=A0ABT3WDH2_9PROT|nr:outer membrane lipoprotein carrier protein LolA [Bombella dulcis]MCX5615839.1 outer membrane lipoprotein carrier protein LolA [Bombella dulcis]
MMLRRAVMACGLALAFGGTVMSGPQAVAAASLTSAQQVWVHRIESSLADTKNFQARFEQVTEQDGRSTGTVLLERPGKMRFSYDPPSPLLLVANEGKVVFQDRSIGQITTIPLDHTPLGLLLRPDPRFSGDVSILGYEQHGSEIELRVTRTENPGEGEMTLFFSTHPLSLKGWTVLDAQGHRTVVHFSNIQTGISVSEDSFILPKDED